MGGYGFGQSGETKQPMLDAKSDEPMGLFLLAIHNFPEKEVVVVFNFDERVGWQGLGETKLGSPGTDVSKFAVKNTTIRPDRDDGRLIELLA